MTEQAPRTLEATEEMKARVKVLASQMQEAFRRAELHRSEAAKQDDSMLKLAILHDSYEHVLRLAVQSPE